MEQLSLAEARYLVRTVLIPFKFQPSQVELRVLDHLLARAPAAFPQLLSVGKWLEGVKNSEVRALCEDIRESVGRQLDSRLATQNALTILCAQKVKLDVQLGGQLIWIHWFQMTNSFLISINISLYSW